jgi:uncharacterized membrane protein YcaP (DUF421 family)
MNSSAFHALWHPDLPVWALVVRGAVVYLAVIVLLRIAGKRQVAQMGMTEFVALLLISNAVQNAMNGGDASLAGGLVLAVTIIGCAYAMTYLTYRSRRIERLIQGRPTLLVHHGQIIHKHLKKELLSVPEMLSVLRKQGVTNLDDVAEAVLESDGFISVTHKIDLERHPQLHQAIREERGLRYEDEIAPEA